MRDEPRKLREIAKEIVATWKTPHYAAVPYVDAMAELDTIDDRYGFDSGKSVVLYFLSNAGSWRGEDAKRIKAELRELVY